MTCRLFLRRFAVAARFASTTASATTTIPSPAIRAEDGILGEHHTNLATGSFQIAQVNIVNARDAKYSSLEFVQQSGDYNCEHDEPFRIPLVWFRDHCRSARFYDAFTNQRSGTCENLFEHSRLSENCYPIEFDCGAQKLRIYWEDGHESLFHIADILKWSMARKANEECFSRTIWNAETLRKIPSISKANFDFPVFSRLFVRFGVVSVVGVSHEDEKDTKKLCEAIAPIHNTLFGDFWQFGTNTNQSEQALSLHQDTAYGNAEIGPHTDGTYFDSPPGIQVFHVTKPSSIGGETVLVDGFYASEMLKAKHPHHFDTLSSSFIEHQYIEGEHGFQKSSSELLPLYARSSLSPVIFSLHTGKVFQIRYNPYDRSPMRSIKAGPDNVKSMEQTVRFYDAYQTLAHIINDDSLRFHLKLQPGTVLFIDNHRVLHGRKAFQGERQVCGCYLSRDGFLAKARPFLSPSFYQNV